jgi:hypothetical protein
MRFCSALTTNRFSIAPSVHYGFAIAMATVTATASTAFFTKSPVSPVGLASSELDLGLFLHQRSGSLLIGAGIAIDGRAVAPSRIIGGQAAVRRIGGGTTVSGYMDLSAWVVGQPERLWLQKTDAQNNVSIMVLGIDDRCIFGGTPSTI